MSSPYANLHIPATCKELGFGAICSYSSTLALLFLFFVVLVVAISGSLHILQHWIEHHYHGISKAGLGSALIDAIGRVKEEFMVTGIIAMLLFVVGRDIEKWTCTKYRGDYSSYKPPGSNYYPPPSYPPPALKGGSPPYKKKKYCEEAVVPFLEQEYAHILLLLAALVNVVYSIATVVITLKRIAGWKLFEDRLQESAELQPLSEAGIKSIASGYTASLFQCLWRQFWIPYIWKGVNYDSYRAARHAAAMEKWRDMLFNELLKKAQENTTLALEGQIHMLFTPDVQGLDKTPLNATVTDKLIAAAQKYRNESYFLAQASFESERNKRFASLYRIKVKQFSFIPLLKTLSAEQFAEDHMMAFLMPTIIGIGLMVPHKLLIFSWLPIVVFGIMVAIGFLLQKILLELKRRYHILYMQEYKFIVARLRWRKAICQVAYKINRPLKGLKDDFSIPKIPDIAQYDQKTTRRIMERANSKYKSEKFDTSQLFPFRSPGLIHKIFIFCYYCNGFFLAMVAYTAWIKPVEFRQRQGIMAWLILFSVICMLHGALNITPLFALITASSNDVPAHFEKNLIANEAKKRREGQLDLFKAKIMAKVKEEYKTVQKRNSTHAHSTGGDFNQSLRQRYNQGGTRDVEAQRPMAGPRHVPTVHEEDVLGMDNASLMSTSTVRSN